MSDYLWPHGLQHARLPCPSPFPRACSNSCALSQWCPSAISFSVVPFSFCHQSFPASGSLLMSRLFRSGGQSIGGSVSASVLPMNIQDWFSRASQGNQLGLPCGSPGKESACISRDLCLIPVLGRSPGEEKGYPVQYSAPENSMDSLSIYISQYKWAEDLIRHFSKKIYRWPMGNKIMLNFANY